MVFFRLFMAFFPSLRKKSMKSFFKCLTKKKIYQKLSPLRKKLTVEVMSKNRAAHSSCLYWTPTTATGAWRPSFVTNTARVAVTLVSGIKFMKFILIFSNLLYYFIFTIFILPTTERDREHKRVWVQEVAFNWNFH